jgi:hypothetical protein
MDMPREYKDHVRVQEEFGLIKVTVGSGKAHCFIGANRKEHAEVALLMIIDMIDAIKDDARARQERKTLGIAKKHMATYLKVVK